MQKIIIAVFLWLLAFQVYATETIFYAVPDVNDTSFSAAQIEKIAQQKKRIAIIAPQIYSVNSQGKIAGSIDLPLLKMAKENQIKVMPLIINANFDQDKFHDFLNNPAAIEKAITGMLELCKKHEFYGLQFDFENIHVNDKNRFTDFFRKTAERLQNNGFILSIAVVPRATDVLNDDYDHWNFNNWSGAYDYAALGQAADFVSIMSYDQHTSLTTPGPIAPLDWVEKTLKYILKEVPAAKVSLGIPTYSGYWITKKMGPSTIPEMYRFRSKEMQISYTKVLKILEKSNQSLQWHNAWQSSYVMFSNQDKNEYLFIEDAKSFQAKADLAKRYHLRGISVWRFGLEDPKIWD